MDRYKKAEIQAEIQIMYNDLQIDKDATKLSLHECIKIYPKLYQKWNKKLYGIELDISECEF